MEGKERNKNKDTYFFKLKKYKANNKMIRREFEYSDLNNYEIMKEKIRNVLKEKYKESSLDRKFLIIILNHPDIEEIFIYSKDNWDLYFKYNLIEKCITNKTLKIEYILFDEEKKDLYINNIKSKQNKKEIKYIIKNLPLNIYFDILIKFFKERNEIMNAFKLYLTAEITKEDDGKLTNIIKENEIKEINEEQKNTNIEENININKIISNDENSNNEKKINKENKIVINRDYLIKSNEFMSILIEQKKMFSDYQSSINIIKNIKKFFEEDEGKNEKNESSENKAIMQTNLILENTNSLENLLNDEFEVNNNNNKSLKSALNPPKEYVKDLMNNENFFKTFSKEQYYVGIEDYNDNLNRESLENLNSKI